MYIPLGFERLQVPHIRQLSLFHSNTMSSRGYVIIALLCAHTFASPTRPWDTYHNATLLTRDIQLAQKPRILDIKKMAAVGDSYSAGIGAGHRLGTPILSMATDITTGGFSDGKLA